MDPQVMKWIAVIGPALALLVAWWPPKPATYSHRAASQVPVVTQHPHTGTSAIHNRYSRP